MLEIHSGIGIEKEKCLRGGYQESEKSARRIYLITFIFYRFLFGSDSTEQTSGMALKGTTRQTPMPTMVRTRSSSKGSVELVEDISKGEGTGGIERGGTGDEELASECSYTESETKRISRKLDMWIMPILFISFGLQYWDKTLISQAALFGLTADLDLIRTIGHDANGNPITSSTRFSNVSWILYLGYLIAAFPMAYLAQRFPTAKVIAASIFLWSVVMMSTAACKNYSQLMVNRFFLGVFESCISPSFTVLLTFWWTRKEQVRRSAIWWGSVGVAQMFGPLASYGLGHIHGSLGSSWKYIYLIAGAIAMAWSLLVLWVLPDDPHRAKWLSSRERAIIFARLKAENASINRHFVAAQFWETIKDYNMYCFAFFLLAGGIPNGCTATFSGIVVHGFGFDNFTSLLLLMPMGAVGCTSALIPFIFSSRLAGWRYYLFALLSLPALLGSFLNWLGPRHDIGLLYFGIILLPANVGAVCVANSIIASNVAGHTKKTTISSASFIGYCIGNIAGPLVFSSTPGPRYSGGFIASLAVLLALITLILYSRWHFARENARRDRVYGPPHDELGLEDVTDRENKNFRYML